jgi:hypothetical protein
LGVGEDLEGWFTVTVQMREHLESQVEGDDPVGDVICGNE